MAKAAGGDRDSRLNGARLISSTTSVSGSFSRSDFDDLVRFSNSKSSSFSLELSNIAKKNNVDVQLYRFLRPVSQVLKSIGKTDFRQLKSKDRNTNFQLVAQSQNGSNQSEKITVDELEQGDYFIRFLRKQGNKTSYVARLTSTAIPSPVTPEPGPGTPLPGPGTPTPDPGTPLPGPGTPTPNPDTPIPTPIPVVPLPDTNTTTGSLTDAETEKRYSINVAAGDFQVNLTGLSADADVQLLSADAKTVLRSSTNAGTNAERFIQPLNAGQYVLRVFRKAGNTAKTDFSLKLTDLVDGIGNTEATANDLGSFISPRVNYVVGSGKESPVDYYKFTLPSRGFVKVELTGKSTDDSTLFGNLDVDLYEQGQPISQGLSANSLGTASEIFGGTLQGGTTYFLRVRPQNGSAEGSTYNLKVTFTSRSADPSIVRDILVGDASSGASNFTDVGGLAYFSANSRNEQGVAKNSLWQSEGTLNRTTRVFDFESSAELSNFTNVNGQLYFVAKTDAKGAELWTSDGTGAGTKLVADLEPGTASSNPQGLTAVGSNLYFYTKVLTGTGVQNSKLYRVAQGSTTVEELTSTNFAAANLQRFDQLTNVNGTLYFSAKDVDGDIDLWRAVPSSGAIQLNQMQLSPDQEGGSSPTNLIDVGGKLFLTAEVMVPGGSSPQRELIRIDTFDTGAYDPANFTRFNLNGNFAAGILDAKPMVYVEDTKTLYFAATGSTSGTELHRLKFTNNTSESVTPELVKDVNSGISGSSPDSLFKLGDQVVFLANDGAGTNLWISDATAANAVKLSSISGLTNLNTLTNFKNLTVVNNKLFFVASDATAGEELRKVTLSGTTQGSLETFELVSGTGGSSPNALAAIGGQLFFVANDGVNGNEPWNIPA